MRTAYYIRLALIFGWQTSMAFLSFYFSKSPDWVQDAFLASGMVLPFVGYFVVFYCSPGFVSPSHIARAIGIVLASIAAAVVGFITIFYFMFGLFMAFGGHHW
jgi:hypothetical protein